MKTIYKLIAIAFGALAVAACSDDLDTRPEGDTMTEDQKKEIYEQNPEKLEADVLSLYSSMIELLAIEDWYGGQLHFDF